jgi:AcrR family transcriptional regulator
MASKDETRQAILEAADTLFMRFGPTKTSVADIARKLGMSPANIYNFYPSREAILEAVGERHFTSLREFLAAQIETIDGDWRKIEALFLVTAQDMRRHLENETDILQLQALQAHHKWRFVDDFHAVLKNTVQQIVSDAMAAGRFRRQDPHEATVALFDCMLGALDPSLILKFDRHDHERRLKSQLGLLEFAFSPPHV